MESYSQISAAEGVGTERVKQENASPTSIAWNRRGGFLLSVVVPVYKEEGNIKEFFKRLMPILSEQAPRFEVIFAMDPSPDRTEEIILQERTSDERIKLLKFSRRIGQP